MSDIVWTIDPTDIRWDMNWSQMKEDGTRCHPNKPEIEKMFEHEAALAHLLINEVVFLNSNWWEDSWPEDAKKTFSISLNCNDVFAWGCADAEGLRFYDLEDVYDHWEKDPSWGPAIWCIKKRKQMPQRPVEKSIREAGIWDLDQLKEEFGLRINYYDTKSSIISTAKYKKYSEWCVEQGKTPLPYDAGWWEGWREYDKANPGWLRAEWYEDVLSTEVPGYEKE